MLASAERTLSLAQQRDQAGLSGRLPVLRAENALILQQRRLTDLQARELAERIQLARALGGGYENQQIATLAAPAAASATVLPH